MPVEEIKKVDKSAYLTEMVHYEGTDAYTALCGAPIRGIEVDDTVDVDCIVCEDMVRGMFQ